MLNKVILKGNVGRAPKIFLTQEGKEVVSFSGPPPPRGARCARPPRGEPPRGWGGYRLSYKNILEG